MKQRPFSLQTLLIVPFVLQVVSITGLIGYLSYRSGQRTIEVLANQIMEKAGELVTQDLNNYLQQGHRINQSYIAALRSGAISLDDLDQLHRFLTLQLFENPLPTSVLFGSPQGEFRFINRVYPEQDFGPNTNVQAEELPYEAGLANIDQPSQVKIFSVNEDGNLQRQTEIIQKADVRDRPWYRQAVATGRPGWSQPFQIGRTEILAINAFAPFYDDTNQLQGVFSVNFSLRQLNTFLKSLSISENGYAFILDSNGLMIANSLEQSAYLATSELRPTHQTVYEPGRVKFERLSATAANHPFLQKAAQQLQTRFGSLGAIQTPQELTVQMTGQRYFLRVIPYQDDYGLEWFIVTGIPEAVFEADIRDNARRTLLLCSFALIGAIGSGIWTARRITRSLLNLTKATQNVADGDLDQTLGTSQIQEIETLSVGFRKMVMSLRQGAELQNNYERDLEQQVAEKTAALNEVQRIAHLGSWTLNVEQKSATLSPELCRIFGIEPQDASNHYQKYLDHLHPDDQAPVQAMIETAIATGQPCTLEYRVVRPDHSIRYVIGQGEAVKDETGRVVKLIGTGLDITTQKQIELALQQSETRLRLITDSVPGCISYIDSQERYRFVNQTYEAWFNLRRDDILGRKVEEVIGPESYVRAQAHIAAALRGETVTYEMELPYQETQVRYVSGVLVPDFGDQNEVNGYYALIIDITDRKQLERALQASEQKTQEIFNSALAAIASMRVFENGSWTIDRVSAGCEALTGFTAEAMTVDENLWIERILPEDWQAYQDNIFINIFAEQTGTYEYRFRHKNGSIRWFSQITNSVRDEAQQCWVVTATSVDITDRKLAEELLMAEFRLRQAIESSIVEGITTISLDGEQTYVNPAFCRMVGWSQEELLGAKPPFVYWPPEEIDHNNQILEHRLASETPIEGIELRLMRRNGEQIDVLLLDAPLRDSQGNIIARLASIYDITERKQAEIRLQEQENLLRAIGDNLPKGFVYQFIYDPDKGFYFNYVSAGVEKVTGLKPEEVIGNFNALADLIIPEDRQLVEQANQASLANLSLFEVDIRKRTLSGELQWSTVRSIPHRLEDGRTVWYGIELDITNLKKAEAALRENEELFRRAFEDAPIGMALVSLDGHLLRVNQSLSQIYGYSTDELVHMSVADISAPEDLAKDMALAAQVLAGEINTYQLEKRFIHKQGHTVYGLLNVSLLRDEQQRPFYFVTQVQDISERHKIDQMKRDFVSIVSHELRTPLTSMRGALGILETGVLKDRPDKAQHMMSVAIQNSDRLIRLVNDILNLERLESGQVTLVKEPCNIGTLMEAAVESLETIAVNANITLKVAPLDWVVPLSPDAILQTLTNLLSNAIKFSATGDTVWLTAEVIEPEPHSHLSSPHPPISPSPHPPLPPSPLPPPPPFPPTPHLPISPSPHPPISPSPLSPHCRKRSGSRHSLRQT